MNKSSNIENHIVIETNTSKKDGHQVCPNCGASEITFNEKKRKNYSPDRSRTCDLVYVKDALQPTELTAR